MGLNFKLVVRRLNYLSAGMPTSKAGVATRASQDLIGLRIVTPNKWHGRITATGPGCYEVSFKGMKEVVSSEAMLQQTVVPPAEIEGLQRAGIGFNWKDPRVSALDAVSSVPEQARSLLSWRKCSKQLTQFERVQLACHVRL